MKHAVKRLSLEDIEKNLKYRLGAVVNLCSLDEAKQYFQSTLRPLIPESWIMNQGEFEPSNDMCGGMSMHMMLSLLNGRNVGPFYVWMMTRQRDGATLEDYGVTNRALADTARKVGALDMKDEPFSLKDGRDTIADPTKWPPIGDLQVKAAQNIIGSVLWVTPERGMDAFDTFRCAVATFNKYYGLNPVSGQTHSSVFGLLWDWDMSQYVIEKPSESGSGHDVCGFWADDDYLYIAQSYGLQAGQKGIQKLHRSIVNRWASEFGMFVGIDATKDQIDALLASGARLNDPWRVNIVRKFIQVQEKFRMPFSWLLAVVKRLLNPSVGGVMLWDTPSHVRYNVRRMCDEAGLPFWTKVTICAIIKQESNWSSKDNKTYVPIISKPNTDGTRDWGLLQINDHKGYHIGPGLYFASTDEVLNNPEKSVRFVIQMAKAGRLDLWSSYKFGAYRQHLLSEMRAATPY